MNPQIILLDEIIVDNFAGGGGVMDRKELIKRRRRWQCVKFCFEARRGRKVKK